jgi:hypothetical protein
MSGQRFRRRYASRGLCWICRRPNVEQGQRGPSLAHQWCRKLVDQGVAMREVRALVVATRPSAGGAA